MVSLPMMLFGAFIRPLQEGKNITRQAGSKNARIVLNNF